ncbi:MAG TPA: hypothetical protein VKY51_02200 [Fredinandcohnia sp.]|nr:hypothetical protein [Fredinandcohnia sp.]
MEGERWGNCKSCRYFASPSHVPMAAEQAKCLHPVHSKYDLVVLGMCGCTGWELRPGLSEEQVEGEFEEQPPA